MEQIHFELSKTKTHNTIEYENLLFCFTISIQAVMTVFCKSIRLFISTRSLDTLFVYALLAMVFVRTLPLFRLKIGRKECFVICGYLFIWLYSIIISDDSSFVLEILADITTTCLLGWISSRVVHVTVRMIHYMRIAAYIFVLRALLDLFVFTSNSNAWYSQYEGYQLYVGLTLLLVPMLIEKKRFDYLAAAVSIFLTLLTGARGPFIFSVASLLVCMIVIASEKRRLFKFLPFIAIATVLIAVNITTIMNFALGFVGIRGGSVRTIQTILNGNFFTYISGRGTIYPIAVEYIKQHLFLGSGFANDRVYISQAMGSYADMAGNYAHNVFLEIGMQLGTVLGVIVILLGVRLIVQTYKRQRTSEERLFYVAMLCSALLPLLVSGSYLTSPMFYVLLGYSFSYRYRANPD